MHVDQFDFHLPDDLIAQHPRPVRGTSRLLVLERSTGRLTHAAVKDLPDWLTPGDLLVVNDTRVFPARLLGRRVPSGGRVEVLLLERLSGDAWDALVHPGQKLRPGSTFVLEGSIPSGSATTPPPRLLGEVLTRGTFGRRTVRLRAEGGADVDSTIDAIGHVPLPPYIRRDDTVADLERYQTVYARERGSVAAPTAGLHFTPEILEAVAARNVERASVTLHVGYGTFKPVRGDVVEMHTVDPEPYEVSQIAADQIRRARSERRRVVAVGTTTVRALESAGRTGTIESGRHSATLFIHPGAHTFRVVDALLTNFHLPRSSLLMLVCAFAGREQVLEAYRVAVAERYHFYSYGDAMLIL